MNENAALDFVRKIKKTQSEVKVVSTLKTSFSVVLPIVILLFIAAGIFFYYFLKKKERTNKKSYIVLRVLSMLVSEVSFLFTLPLLENLFIFHKYSFSLKGFAQSFSVYINSLKEGIFSSEVSVFNIFIACFILVVYVIELIFFINGVRNTIKRSKNKNAYTQGTARWATYEDLEDAKLVPSEPKGICFAQTYDAVPKDDKGTDQKFHYEKLGKRLLSDNTAYHTLVIGGTGSYKGVSVAIPTLLTWKESVIFVDPKGESYEITGGYRSHFSNVFYFNTSNPAKSCHLNPLDFIPRDKTAAAELGKIVHMIHPDQSKDAYWDKAPRMLLEMLMGYVILHGERKSIPEAADLLYSGEGNGIFQTILDDMSITVDADGNELTKEEIEGDGKNKYKGKIVQRPRLSTDDPLFPLQQMVVANAILFRDMAAGQDVQQLTTHLTTIKGDLDVYTRAGAMLENTDFTLDEVCDAEKPISLYLCVSVAELQEVMPMFKLIYSLILKHLLKGSQKHKHRLLLGLDEFSQFKKFEIIAEQLPFVRSYGIKIMAFIQSISQLDEWYGHDGRKAMMDNFQMKIFLKADENETLQYFETKLGKETLNKTSVSFSQNRKEQGISSSNESVSEVGRSLMTSEQLGKMPLSDCIVFSPEIPAYKARKIQYFSDERFKDKIKLPIIAPQGEHTYPTVLNSKEMELVRKYSLDKLETELSKSLKEEEEWRERNKTEEDEMSEALDEALEALQNQKDEDLPEFDEDEEDEEETEGGLV